MEEVALTGDGWRPTNPHRDGDRSALCCPLPHSEDCTRDMGGADGVGGRRREGARRPCCSCCG